MLQNILQEGEMAPEEIGLAPEEGRFVAVERALEENSHYSFHVMLTNEVGTVKSVEIQISKHN